MLAFVRSDLRERLERPDTLVKRQFSQRQTADIASVIERGTGVDLRSSQFGYEVSRRRVAQCAHSAIAFAPLPAYEALDSVHLQSSSHVFDCTVALKVALKSNKLVATRSSTGVSS